MTSGNAPATRSLTASDGLALHVRRWEDQGSPPKWTFVIAHGLGEHSGRYDRFARWFAARGARVFALDHRGHGLSQGQRGHAERLTVLLDDLDRVITEARAGAPQLPLVLVGHSWGGLLAIAYALEHPDRVDRLVVSAPALRIKARIPPHKRIAARILPRLLPRLALANEVDPATLSRDRSVGDAYARDPLVHDRISGRLYEETFARGGELISRASDVRMPVLVLHGEDDRLIDPQGSRAFFERTVVDGRAMRTYAGFYHEIFNEPEQERVFRDIEAWLTPPN